MKLESLIRDIPDFPKPGILFKDITPLLADSKALGEAVRAMAAPFLEQEIDLVVGMESRGFIFAPGVAMALNAGFVPVRKKGKLPFKTEQVQYALEYGHDYLEMHVDAIQSGQKALVVDDLLATGGTAHAAADLIKRLGGQVVGYSFLIELGFLKGRDQLHDGLCHACLCVN